jgi:hypothetical protein
MGITNFDQINLITGLTVSELADNAVETAKIKDANVTNAKLAATAVTNAKVATSAAIVGSKLATNATVRTARTVWFNLDNGAGTTIDDVIWGGGAAIHIRAARIVYQDATTGTVAGGSAKVGTTVGGAEVVAATNYENGKTVGTTTAMALVGTPAGGFAVAAGTPVLVRHTGVAVTNAGQSVVEIDYTVDD